MVEYLRVFRHVGFFLFSVLQHLCNQDRESNVIAHGTPDEVNTVPVETLDACRDHGDPQARLEQDVEHAAWVLEQLPQLGMDIDKLTQQLEDEGVDKFNKPFDKLMDTLASVSPGQMREL